MHSTPLVATIVAGIGLAFAFGAVAHRLRLPPLVGYLLAGVVIGPTTPGFIADPRLATELAEIGIILLMFGVGLHFSLNDLLAVRSIVVPGALARMAIAALLGMALANVLGWPIGASFLFGLALSVASTVVALRALQERHLLESERGRIAMAWLIVEDLAMVLALVLAPAIAQLLNRSFAEGAEANAMSMGPLLGTIGFTLLKVAAFVALMLVIGRRAIPWLLHTIAHTGSRELFRLAVLAVALCVAYGAAVLFGVSFALGAFFAGMVLSESQLSQRAAQETLPLRDAFAVLFFVSVGMLFSPRVVTTYPGALFATVLIITAVRAASAYVIVRAFGQSPSAAATISAALAQIGEFSFILAALGVSLNLMPRVGQDLILAGAIISILLNPFLFTLLDRLKPWLEKMEAEPALAPAPAVAETEDLPVTRLRNHTVVVGHGRVGSIVATKLCHAHRSILVIEDRADIVAGLRAENIEAMVGNAADPSLLAAANIGEASTLFVAIPEAFEAGQIVEQARQANPRIEIFARAHTQAEAEHLRKMGADHVAMGEYELANAMLAQHGAAHAAENAPAPGDGAGRCRKPRPGGEFGLITPTRRGAAARSGGNICR